MPRPKHCRRVGFCPNARYFKPQGIHLRDLEEKRLSLDELEALRLADMQGLHQERAAQQMGVSRQTFGRIVADARAKVAQALVQGKAVRIGAAGTYQVVVRAWGSPAAGVWPEMALVVDGRAVKTVNVGRADPQD